MDARVAIDRGDLELLRQKRARYQGSVDRGEEPPPTPTIKALLRIVDVLTLENLRPDDGRDAEA